MDWVASLNKALDFIEDTILDNVTGQDIADHVFISNSHFQRTFLLMTGFTLGEYIRNRRLTLAGLDLTVKGTRVIDTALKYGYETPESFSKAFRRFHGVTPAQAKKGGMNLKSFNRLTIKIIMEGGSVMDYRIVNEGAFRAAVKVKVFTPENSAKEIPAFWTGYFASGVHKKVPGDLGICGDAIPGEGDFKYGIGCREDQAKEIPEGFELWPIPAQTWAVFTCVGAMPLAIQTMWKRIYSEWLPHANYELIPGYEFEYYTKGDNRSADYVSEIWIPVKEKPEHP